MPYFDAYLIPVPHAKKANYQRLAERAAPIFMEHGALHVVECWGDDVSHGAVTDFYRAVAAEEDENVVFSWMVWPDKATRDAAHPKVMADPRFAEMGGNDVFNGKRMVMGGFDALIDTGAPSRFGYIEAYVFAVPNGKKDALIAHEAIGSAIMLDHGATRLVECWGDDVQCGEVTDFQGAVQASDDETVVIGWAEYPDKATRDKANETMMSDPRFADMGDTPFDGKRMIFSGFEPILQA